MLGIDLLINGATTCDEPGVFMSFEETDDELYEDVASLNIDLQSVVSNKNILLEYVLLERLNVQPDGEFNLEGLFVRLELAIDSIGAKRVELDSIDSLFADVTDVGILRLEIKRLFRWLKDKTVAALVSGETTQGTYTRHGLEAHVSDCIIYVDNRVREQISTRRMRVIKYRGSNHGTNEYPFVIDKNELRLLPLPRQDSINPEQPSDCRRASPR